MIIQDRDSLAFNDKTFVQGHRILIAYATQSGNAKAIAQRIYAVNQDCCDIYDVASIKIELIQEYERVVFVVSTYGNGEPPLTAETFYAELCQSSLDLHAIKFAVLALGDKQYLKFCGFGNSLSHQLIRLGAIPRVPLTEVNRNDAITIEHWWSKLHETFELNYEINEDWEVATLMDKVEEKGAIKFILYIKPLQFASAKILKIKDSRNASNLIEVNIVSSELDPFTSVIIEDNQTERFGSSFWRQLSASQPGDKWHVQIC